MRRRAVFAMLAFALLASGSAAAQDGGLCDPKPKAAKLDFTLKDAAGKPVKLADFKGKVMVLNFWATWCVPCRAEFPRSSRFREMRPSGTQVVGVSIDDP
jgi:peroxiredoxin